MDREIELAELLNRQHAQRRASFRVSWPNSAHAHPDRFPRAPSTVVFTHTITCLALTWLGSARGHRRPHEFIYGKYNTNQRLSHMFACKPHLDHPFSSIHRIKLLRRIVESTQADG